MPEAALPEPPPPPRRPRSRTLSEDSVRGLLQHVDERYQALGLRLQRMEGAMRKLVAANREAVKAAEARRREDLEALVARTGRGLAAAFARQRRGIRADLRATATAIVRAQRSASPPAPGNLERALARAARRQEVLLDRHFTALRESVDSVGRSLSGLARPDPEALTALREMEDEVDLLSGELADLGDD